MPPIAAFSQSVGSFLLALGQGLLYKPQQHHLHNFVLALIVTRGRHTLSEQARAWRYERVESSVKRFLTDSPWNLEALIGRYQQLLLALVLQRPAAEPIRLIIDDTVTEKTGRHFEGLSRHYGNGKLRWGHCKVTLMVCVGPLKVPFASRLYVTKKTAAAEGRPFYTKLELAQQMLAEFVVPEDRRVTVLFDSFYTSKALLRYICAERQWDLLARIESNRKVTYRGRSRIVSSLVSSGRGPHHWQPLGLAGKDYVGLQLKVTLWEGRPGALLMSCDPDKPDDVHFYISNRRDLGAGSALRLYQHRWYIETYHRDVKQLLGLAHYQLRSLVGLNRYWFLVDLAYCVLRLQTCSAEPQETGLTLGQLRQQVQREEKRRRVDAVVQAYLATGDMECAYAAAGCA